MTALGSGLARVARVVPPPACFVWAYYRLAFVISVWAYYRMGFIIVWASLLYGHCSVCMCIVSGEFWFDLYGIVSTGGSELARVAHTVPPLACFISVWAYYRVGFSIVLALSLDGHCTVGICFAYVLCNIVCVLCNIL